MCRDRSFEPKAAQSVGTAESTAPPTAAEAGEPRATAAAAATKTADATNATATAAAEAAAAAAHDAPTTQRRGGISTSHFLTLSILISLSFCPN